MADFDGVDLGLHDDTIVFLSSGTVMTLLTHGFGKRWFTQITPVGTDDKHHALWGYLSSNLIASCTVGAVRGY